MSGDEEETQKVGAHAYRGDGRLNTRLNTCVRLGHCAAACITRVGGRLITHDHFRPPAQFQKSKFAVDTTYAANGPERHTKQMIY